MVANKIVVGAAALGVAGYTLNERLKDRRVKQEEEEHQQRMRNREEEQQERLRKANNMREFLRVEEKIQGETEFSTKLLLRLEVRLVELLTILHNDATKHKEIENSSLFLPLLSSHFESDPSEVVLGGALALSKSTTIEHTLEVLCTPHPGLALAKLSENTLSRMCKVFETFARSSPIPSLPDEYMHAFITLAAFKNGQPTVYRFRAEAHSQIQNLFKLARLLKLCLLPETSFKQDIPKLKRAALQQQKVRITYTRRKSEPVWIPKLGDIVYLMNFDGSFAVEGYIDGTCLSCDFSNPRILNNSDKSMLWNPNRQHIAVDLLSGYFASRAAFIAASRLKRLRRLGEKEGVSLEHVAVECGYAGPYLHDMATNDVRLIESESSRMISTLTTTLKKCVPSPDGSAEVTEELTSEITTFVAQYIQFLNLSYCKVPRIGGRTPSQRVEKKKDVYEEAIDGFLKGDEPRVRLTRRILELDELDR